MAFAGSSSSFSTARDLLRSPPHQTSRNSSYSFGATRAEGRRLSDGLRVDARLKDSTASHERITPKWAVAVVNGRSFTLPCELPRRRPACPPRVHGLPQSLAVKTVKTVKTVETVITPDRRRHSREKHIIDPQRPRISRLQRFMISSHPPTRTSETSGANTSELRPVRGLHVRHISCHQRTQLSGVVGSKSARPATTCPAKPREQARSPITQTAIIVISACDTQRDTNPMGAVSSILAQFLARVGRRIVGTPCTPEHPSGESQAVI
ncbi:hypothetical protein PMIN01_04526 [Paraphaeosphaeria minitans]|uniref:Uncharacterized protein n=1 Tax=Paraphaeosphaeria minitans TaxID=565426 RepID=A0A9P6KRZ4_9PLEO|nr:hypothetical protein PMIN01_04526 [Paraphaeosphaeria minitans]